MTNALPLHCRHAAAPALLVGLLMVLQGCSESNSQLSHVTSDQLVASATEPFNYPHINRSKFARQFWPTDVSAPITAPVGTVLVDTQAKQLYVIRENGMARRYGIAVGASGHAWSGEAVVKRKNKWPVWYPTDDMRQTAPDLPKRIEAGLQNPLGARAIYLYDGNRDTLYRIHGTTEPWSIGTEASSGCIRMINEDVIELYNLVPIGAKVIVR
jgi:lipoprotein-anchoring transpeptidase ErfK/SrfK